MIKAPLGVWGMKTKKLHKDKVNIITLGCSKNMVDSEVLSGQLLANEIDVVHENKKLDHNIVVVNTCGFIEKAKEEFKKSTGGGFEYKPLLGDRKPALNYRD